MESRARISVLILARRRLGALRVLRVGSLLAVLGVAGAASDPPPAASRVFTPRDVAFHEIFGPHATFERRTRFLDAAEVDSVQQWARAPLPRARVTYWVVSRADSQLGTLYLDTHVVRHEHQTLLIWVTPSGSIGTVRVLAFDEPEDYLPPRRWFERFTGRRLSPALRPGGDVDAISGATLSVRATCAAVRRALALDALRRREQP